MIQPHYSFAITRESQVYYIKRQVRDLSRKFGLDEIRSGKVDIIIAEMASNLINHKAAEGEILVKAMGNGNTTVGMEILSLDKGPGMKNAEKMVEDGISSRGSPGHGLGSIKRLSHEFDIYSSFGIGTFILARVYKNEALIPHSRNYAISGVMVSKPGFINCGDGWSWKEEENILKVLAVDGLGHGEKAQEAARHSIAAFDNAISPLPSEMIKTIHQNIKNTRGAVGVVVNIDFAAEKLAFCGIGNIVGKVFRGDDSYNMVFHSGILGNNAPNRILDRELSYHGAPLLVLNSDGLSSGWNLKDFPGIRKRNPVIIAAALYKRFTRGTDDVLIIICKH